MAELKQRSMKGFGTDITEEEGEIRVPIEALEFFESMDAGEGFAVIPKKEPDGVGQLLQIYVHQENEEMESTSFGIQYYRPETHEVATYFYLHSGDIHKAIVNDAENIVSVEGRNDLSINERLKSNVESADGTTVLYHDSSVTP